MVTHRTGLQLLIGLCLAGWVLPGCQSQQQLEDFYYADADEIIERSEREEMLHVHGIVDLKGSAFIPFDSDYDVGAGIHVKGQLEVAKNLYLGVELGYVYQEVDETASDVLDAFTAGDPGQAAAAADLDPEQWMERFDRWNILFVFDYDIPLTDGDAPVNPLFRFGLGLGATIIDGKPDKNAFAPSVDSRIFAQFLARPSVQFRIPIVDFCLFFIDASVDFVPVDKMTIDLGGQRTKIDEDVYFSGFNLGGGFSFTW